MGSLSGGNKVIKYLVFIFNFIFFLLGVAMMAFGIYAKVGKQTYIDLSHQITNDSQYFTAGNLLIAVGVIIMIVAFFGCCGAVKECTWMLMIFFVLLVIIFIIELAACIVGYIKRDKIEELLDKDLEKAIKESYTNKTNSPVVKAIDNFQKTFKCCGYSGWESWKYSLYHNSTKMAPKSCCNTDVNCPTADATIAKNVYFKRGCKEEFTKWFKDNMYTIGSIALAFAIIQILGIVFSMMLYCSIKKAGEIA